MAEKMWLDPGCALDLTTNEDGVACEFSTQANRAEALKTKCEKIRH